MTFNIRLYARPFTSWSLQEEIPVPLKIHAIMMLFTP